MKGRINSRLWWAIAINAAVLCTVLGLAYGAGARSSGLRLRDFSILPPMAGFELLGAAFLVVAATIFLFVWLDNSVQKRLAELVDTADRVAGGDYEAHAIVSSDDFGVVAEAINIATEKLARLSQVEAEREAVESEIATLEDALAQLGRGEFGARLRATVPSLAPLADSFNEAADAIARRIDRMRAGAGELAAASNEAHKMVELCAVAFEHSQDELASASGALDALSAGARKMNVDADGATEAARRALEFADHGNHAVRDAAEGMQGIRSSMQATAAKIKALGDRSLEIYEIINIIHETNLLALNAVLEASRGGKGESLDVLAVELRKLADHSRGATRDIVTLLKSIQAESNDSVVIMEQATRTADQGARLTEQASEAFQGIAALLRQTAELALTISGGSRQQAAEIEEAKTAAATQAEAAERNALRVHDAVQQAEQVVRLADQGLLALSQMRTGPAVVKQESKPDLRAAVAGD